MNARIRKDQAPINPTRMRHAAHNILNREPSKIAIKRAINPQFRAALLAC
jgi:hypothetical protein